MDLAGAQRVCFGPAVCRNVLQAAFASVYLWAAVCLFLSQGYTGYDAAVALYLGAPLAALAGTRLAASRADRVSRSDPAAAWTTFDIELRARYALHSILWGHPTQEIGVIGGHRARSADVESGAAAGGGDSPTAAGSAAGGAALLADSSDSAMDDFEMQARAVRALLSPADIAAAAAIFNAGCALFRLSPMMHIVAARFFLCYAGNRHLHMR